MPLTRGFLLCNIELHFDKSELSLIFSESINDLNGGQFLKLNKWILDEPEKLTLSYVINQLNIERVDYSKKTEKLDLEHVRLHLARSNVKLSFLEEENQLADPNEFRLSAFSLIKL